MAQNDESFERDLETLAVNVMVALRQAMPAVVSNSAEGLANFCAVVDHNLGRGVA